MTAVQPSEVRRYLGELDMLRRERGLSWQRLAARAGIPASTLHAWMSPQRSRLPAWDEIRRVVAACGADERDWLARWRAAGATAPVPVERPVPAQLPLDLRGFTGRTTELTGLAALADGGGPVIVSGGGGVGKTALAVHWAHGERDAYPDGQLHANLRGYGPQRPAEPADVLAGFLRALGVPDTELPLEQDARSAALRSALAGRRVLLLLDNARSAEQVRPLLPGTPGALVLITSRDSLAGLVARDGARRLELDLPAGEQALALLRASLGERVDAEPAAAAELVRRCARLPLALRLTAELALARPSAPLGLLVAELAGAAALDVLDAGGDEYTAVRSVFSWSYARLPERAARLFRLLGVHPARDVEAHSAVALTGVSLADTRRDLETLARAHLVRRTAPARYELHDLLRAYAAELATGCEREAAQSAALEFYAVTTAAAMAVLHPGDAPGQPVAGAVTAAMAGAAGAAPIPDVSAARAWLDAERANLVGMIAGCADDGRQAHALRLATTVARYLGTGHFAEALVVYRHAERAAGAVGDAATEAWALERRATILHQLGRPADAVAALRSSLALREDLGDVRGQAQTLVVLGAVHRWSGAHDAALHRLRDALAKFRLAGDPRGEADALINLGGLDVLRGEYEPARDHLERALRLLADAGDRLAAANVLEKLSTAHRGLGDHDRAVDCAARALAVCREVGERFGEVYTLNALATAVRLRGEHERSRALYTEAVELADAIGERFARASALDGLGVLHTAAGRPGTAIGHHRQALAVYREMDIPHSQAAALNSLGEAHLADGRADAAYACFTEAMELAVACGAAEEQHRAHAALATPAP